LRDLRRIAIASQLPRSEDWESECTAMVHCRTKAETLQRARLLAALSVGQVTSSIFARAALRLGVISELDTALEAFVQGNSAVAIARLLSSTSASQAIPTPRRSPPSYFRARGSHPGHLRGDCRARLLLRRRGDCMRFAEIDLSGSICCAHLLMMVGAWFVTIALRRLASRSGCCVTSGIRPCSCSPCTLWFSRSWILVVAKLSSSMTVTEITFKAWEDRRLIAMRANQFEPQNSNAIRLVSPSFGL